MDFSYYNNKNEQVKLNIEIGAKWGDLNIQNSQINSIFAKVDNGDGIVSKDEFSLLDKIFKKVDGILNPNLKNNVLENDELEVAIKEFDDNKTFFENNNDKRIGLENIQHSSKYPKQGLVDLNSPQKKEAVQEKLITNYLFTKDSYVDEPKFFCDGRVLVPQNYDEIANGWLNGLKDARGQDISNLSLSNDELINLRIDSTTIMNDKQRAVVTENLEKMKNPGLGEDVLHSKGITGKNVKIAIIDGNISYNQEIESNIIHYEDLTNKSEGSFHMNAVASIAAGKSCGIAPDAKLVCYSANSCLTYSIAIDKIIEQNENLKNDKKSPISVISISDGFDGLPDYESNYKILLNSIQKAKENGIAVITCDPNLDGKNRHPVGANPSGDINSHENYKIWKKFTEDDWYYDKPEEEKDNVLLIPGEHRTVAGQFNDYRHEGADGGESWTVPYLAGVFAQVKQVRPDITYDEFYKIVLETADKCYNYDDKQYIGKIINPVKIIEKIQL